MRFTASHYRVGLVLLVSLVTVVPCLVTRAADGETNGSSPDGPTARPVQDAKTVIDSGHNLLQEVNEKADALRVGQVVGALRFYDLAGESHYLEDLRRRGATLFVFMSTKCPLVKRYTQRLIRLHEEVSGSTTMFGVFSNAEDDRAAVQRYCQEVNFSFPVVHDSQAYLANRLGATMSPQAFLIDNEGVLRYRGAIDDNRYETRVKQHFLRDAATSLIAGRQIDVTDAKSLGCTLHLPETATEERVTYNRHVARILQDNCQSCHRSDQVAPFTLTSYDDARTWAEELRAYTKSRLMPPWKAKPGFGVFQHDRSLTEQEIATIDRWVEQGAPEGDPAELPPAPRYAEQWVLGAPDLIVEMPEEYVIGPEGEDDYRHFIVPTDFDKDVYVEAIDVQPGNRQTVHHVIVFTDTSGKARELDQADAGPGYTNFGGPGFEVASMVGGWAPGTMPTVLPPGTGTWVPKGADIVLQVHYYRTGVEERDRTKVGLYFSESAQPAPAFSAAVINTKFVIPPGESRYEVRAEWSVPADLYALNVYPHMHLLGEEMKVVARLPDGKVKPMIWIEDWDFNWQGYYFFERPMLLPKGTVVQLVSYFDNSAENPNNPNHPPKPVGWGEKTTDEMSIAFLTCVSASEFNDDGDKSSTVAQR